MLRHALLATASFAAACAAFSVAQDTQPLLAETTSTTTLSTPSATESKPSLAAIAAEEPFWGRIYLRHGVMPIQYFRDSFGGPMVASEVEFVFPRDQSANRFGCELLSDDERAVLQSAAASNTSAVLVVDRGECTFEDKSRNAQMMGAAGLLVISSDETASRPVALLEDEDDITIPSMMVRKSAGELLRAAIVGAKQRVFGRLLPMVCTSRPYKCAPRTKSEQKYIDAFMARSGVLVESSGDGEPVGEFLSSTFGGVMPLRATALPLSELLHATVVCQNSDTEKMPRLDGQVALVAASDASGAGMNSECSIIDMVLNAQRAGAVTALIVAGNNKTVSTHLSPLEDWQGYNVTIFSGVISASTALKLTQLQSVGSAVRFELKNEIADAWDQIHQLQMHAAWPLRKDRKEKLLKQLMTTFALNVGQFQVLKDNFLTIGGGSRKAWDLLVAPAEHDAEGEPIAAKLTEPVVATAESHEEL